MNKTELRGEIDAAIADCNLFALKMILRFISLSQNLPEYASRAAVNHMENVAVLLNRKHLLRDQL